MAASRRSTPRRPKVRPSENLMLSVQGYKAVRKRQELCVAPLTIISGVNSSGKSSFMQPFLLMKQTFDSTFDPGPLLLYGSNVKVTDYAQIFSRGKSKHDVAKSIEVSLRSGERSRTLRFGTNASGNLRVELDSQEHDGTIMNLSDPLTPTQRDALRGRGKEQADRVAEIMQKDRGVKMEWKPTVYRNRCFLEPMMEIRAGDSEFGVPLYGYQADDDWISLIRGIIHVPGLRGNPERAYSRSAVGDTYPGTFETYVASIVLEWSETNDERLANLAHDVESLGLTWKVIARRVDDASVELLVGRMPKAQQGGAHDLVSVADVGFGVSQTLPVIVALQAANSGQIVYIEQPEIHLHPRAQFALADCLVAAARRGVRVIAETHSSLLIRGIQIAIASGRLPVGDLSLNWFSRNSQDGSQQITMACMDEMGRFGDWPVDFDDVTQGADWAYLDAIEGSM